MAKQREELDVGACLRQGAIGALGAIPGTFCAHPCDVIKIRMQITGAGSYQGAIRGIIKEAGGVRGFYRGLTPAIEQRMVARGPMFLVSELFTQNVERYMGLEGVKARFVGSVGSGYTVGFLAGIAAVSYTHLRAHETPEHLVCRLLLEKKKNTTKQ
eukprot:TRINITY_DN19916_c0_g1_i2.p1 TRINITY_DN19916_c0_g1~~TRINITY_DN19916_c0_g1_i2.p1  ORF type:complete len:157 (+),score=37.79 TRINITY_DN19916_c0_g1_i2:226-696(+)